MKIVGIQGDLLIVKIDKLPEEAKSREGKVLVFGEATGHAHRLVEGNVYEADDRILFTVPFQTEIIHEEHHPLPIVEKGTYEIIRQKEYKNKDMTALVVD